MSFNSFNANRLVMNTNSNCLGDLTSFDLVIFSQNCLNIFKNSSMGNFFGSSQKYKAKSVTNFRISAQSSCNCWHSFVACSMNAPSCSFTSSGALSNFFSAADKLPFKTFTSFSRLSILNLLRLTDGKINFLQYVKIDVKMIK